MITLAETSIGGGMTWGAVINGEMKLLEEIVHKIDVILSVAPYLILTDWFQKGASCDESFKESTRNLYETIEASHRTHLQLPTRIGEVMRKWDEDFFRMFAKSEDDLKTLIKYDRSKYSKTSSKLLKIYQNIERGYVSPTTSYSFPKEYHKLDDSEISDYDILQHDILSTIVSNIINTGKPLKSIDYLAKKREPPYYNSAGELARELRKELKTAGYNTINSANLHVRMLCSYNMITQAILANKMEILIETMQELLGWLTMSGFHNVFQVNENRNYIEFHTYHETYFRNKPLSSNCIIEEIVYRLVKSLPKERKFLDDVEDLSEQSSVIGRAFMKSFIELEDAANNVKSKCPICNETFQKIQKTGSSSDLTNSKSLMYEASDLHGEWLFDEIQIRSKALLNELEKLGLTSLD